MSGREEQFGEQGDYQNMMSMAMVMQLQKEFETLKKNIEEELSMSALEVPSGADATSWPLSI